MFSSVNIGQVIDWEGWVFCTSQDIGWGDQITNNKMSPRDVKPYSIQLNSGFGWIHTKSSPTDW